MNVRTRFAPSPTGFLHVGGLRTALYSYLFARKNGGKFLLRVEDTDRERFVEGGIENIIQSLDWAYIDIDEGVKMTFEGEIMEEGDYGPYIQSKRLNIYREHAERLLETGHAYYCFCTKRRLEELRAFQIESKQPTMYDGKCRTISLPDARKRLAAGETAVVRMSMPKTGVTEFSDLIRGHVSFENALIDDQVLMKSDGFPTYHLAAVIDDHLMQITHVIRGEEWLPSTPKHLQLYNMFGWQTPAFAHLSLLINEQKQKLSKRHGDVSVKDFNDAGYVHEALVNFVAFLGWNPGDEREMFTLAELEKEFTIERVTKAAAVFNREKLDWYNQQYIRKMDLGELVRRTVPFLEKAELVTWRGSILNDDNRETYLWLQRALALERDRVTTLADFPPAIRFLFELPAYEPELLVWKKNTNKKTKGVLSELIPVLEPIPEPWVGQMLEASVRGWIEAAGCETGDILWPMRVALSGQKNSPGPFEIAAVLGKEKSLKRLKHALQLLS